MLQHWRLCRRFSYFDPLPTAAAYAPTAAAYAPAATAAALAATAAALAAATHTAAALAAATSLAATALPSLIATGLAAPAGLRRGRVRRQPELRGRGVLHGGLSRLPLPQAAARLERRPSRRLLGLQLGGRVRWRHVRSLARPPCDDG